MSVSVLFARSDSIYFSMPNLDVWDKNRDARNYTGTNPVIAHPPCRAWGKLKHFAKPLQGEKDLARCAAKTVIKNGGVLEHPNGSSLFSDMQLNQTAIPDDKGCFTIVVDQHWFGHKAKKQTKLFICGIKPIDIPPIPLSLSEPLYQVGGNSKNGKKNISKKLREATPEKFAYFLIEIARCAAK